MATPAAEVKMVRSNEDGTVSLVYEKEGRTEIYDLPKGMDMVDVMTKVLAGQPILTVIRGM